MQILNRVNWQMLCRVASSSAKRWDKFLGLSQNAKNPTEAERRIGLNGPRLEPTKHKNGIATGVRGLGNQL